MIKLLTKKIKSCRDCPMRTIDGGPGSVTGCGMGQTTEEFYIIDDTSGKDFPDECPLLDVSVTKDNPDNLQQDSFKLAALMAAGVDNWIGYDSAMEILDEMNEREAQRRSSKED